MVDDRQSLMQVYQTAELSKKERSRLPPEIRDRYIEDIAELKIRYGIALAAARAQTVVTQVIVADTAETLGAISALIRQEAAEGTLCQEQLDLLAVMGFEYGADQRVLAQVARKKICDVLRQM